MNNQADSKEVPPARNKSWTPGQKGQGGEGMSKGYGGSAGDGTGPSGPDTDQPRGEGASKQEPGKRVSESLPSRETIGEVLR